LGYRAARRLAASLAGPALSAALSFIKLKYRDMVGPGAPFGAEVPPPSGADAWERFVAFTGRDPRAVSWPRLMRRSIHRSSGAKEQDEPAQMSHHDLTGWIRRQWSMRRRAAVPYYEGRLTQLGAGGEVRVAVIPVTIPVPFAEGSAATSRPMRCLPAAPRQTSAPGWQRQSVRVHVLTAPCLRVCVR